MLKIWRKTIPEKTKSYLALNYLAQNKEAKKLEIWNVVCNCITASWDSIDYKPIIGQREDGKERKEESQHEDWERGEGRGKYEKNKQKEDTKKEEKNKEPENENIRGEDDDRGGKRTKILRRRTRKK